MISIVFIAVYLKGMGGHVHEGWQLRRRHQKSQEKKISRVHVIGQSHVYMKKRRSIDISVVGVLRGWTDASSDESYGKRD